ncbi:MAG: hypothetical protein Q9191_000902 [Dirinaria sp. TL-2023a]
MQSHYSPTQGSQSPRSVLPPLSKYYYGPAQERASPQRANNSEDLSRRSPFSTPPSLPPRQPANPEPLPASQWINRFVATEQLWNLPGPPSSTPPSSHMSNAPYDPNTYGLMPGAHQPADVLPAIQQPQNPPSGRRPENSTWEDDYNYANTDEPAIASKPPLPPRPYASTSQANIQASSSDQMSYGLDVRPLEYLSSVAYSPGDRQPAQNSQVPSQTAPFGIASPPPSGKLPPPPPPKLPRDHDAEEAQRFHFPDYPQPSGLSRPQRIPKPETLSEGQRQHLAFEEAQKDQVTYSIPPSVWRQDPPAVQTQTVGPSPDSGMRNDQPQLRQAKHLYEERATPPDGVYNADALTVARHHQTTGNGLQEEEYRTTSGQNDHPKRGSGSPSYPEEATERVQIVQKDTDAYHQSHGPHPSVQQEPRDTPDDGHHRSDSFYWQSPHSSVHSIKADQEEQSANATPSEPTTNHQAHSAPYTDVTRNDHANLLPSTLLSHSTLGISALGAGGPSDWEYLGDYEGEDIDDTELYSRPRPPTNASAVPESAELPAEISQSKPPKESTAERVSEQPTAPDISAACDEGVHPKPTESMIEEIVVQAEQWQDAHKGEEVLELQNQGQVGKNTLDQQPGFSIDLTTKSASDTPKREDLHLNSDESIPAWSRAASTENSLKPNSLEPTEAQRHTPFENHSPEHTNKDLEVLEEPAAGEQAAGEPALAAVSVAHNPSNETGIAQQTKRMEADRTPLGEAREEGAGGPINERTSSQAPNSSQATGMLSTVKDTNSHKSDSIDEIAPSKQPSFTPNGVSFSRAQETEDPYAGLDAWGKASLNRYIAMLREESQAETDKEKLNIFTVFANRESRLRAVLYGADNEPVATRLEEVKTSPIKRASTTTYKHTSKALPALPESTREVAPREANSHSRKPSKKLSAAAILGNPKPTLKSLDTNDTSSADIASAMTDSPNSIQYSPGGRPVVVRPPKDITPSSKTPIIETAFSPAISGSLLPDGSIDIPIPASTDQPPAEVSSAYIPFKFGDGQSEAKNYTANRLSKRQSVFRPYSKMMNADDYPQIFQKDETSGGNGPPVPSGIDPTPAPLRQQDTVELDLRRFERADFDPLVSVLPEAGEIRPESLQLSELRQIMDAVPDDFSFIHQSVVAWDSKAKKARQSNERQRHARQVESEQRIDALFNDHEIGYGDISELESGFKRSEAARKADEDRAEYQTFVSEVFDIVWTRLHYEIDQLNPSYQDYTRKLDHTTTGKEMFDSSLDQFALAPTMDALLTLHQKLEIRHEKAFQAVIERDRRLKKTELSQWYSLGNVAKVKQMERQFEQAEKKAILDYCRQRDIRANSLMDNIDQNTLRGVGANQDYMEMVMKAVRRIASGRAFASQPGSSEPGVGLEEVTKAKSITKALATSSEQIVQTFHVADMLLNAADYELSVAKAKLQAASPATFQNLKEERAKEDQKLMRDLEHRLALIREDSRRTHDEIVKLLLFLGVQSGHAPGSTTAPKATDPGHEERLQQALEDAKRRNAALNHGALSANSS